MQRMQEAIDSKTAVVVYVADKKHVVDLVFSMTSWRRFCDIPVVVVDIGLGTTAKRVLQGAFADVSWIGVDSNRDFVDQRSWAYYQKSRVGLHVSADTIVFLDTDIVVVCPSFFSSLLAVKKGEVRASPSAWDKDLTWTYSEQSLPILRSISGMDQLALSERIVNSGVWSMHKSTAPKVSQVWSDLTRAAVTSPSLRKTLNAGTRVGDQEFLSLATAKLGMWWVPLHGSHNMQVHDTKMYWRWGDGQVVGGHFAEARNPLRGYTIVLI